MSDPRAARIAAIIGDVLRQAVQDARAAGIVLIDDGSPGARLAAGWCRDALGRETVWIVAGSCADAEAEERLRLEARIEARRRGALVANPACKTALLLGDAFPPEPLLPLGDLYAREIRDLAGDVVLPPAAARVAEMAGGIDAVDAALFDLLERRADEAQALAGLPSAAARALVERLEANRFARRRPGLIPKLGQRTLGIDLFG